ncbi:MAG: class I SAM-dependent methyltransferase [Scytonematopsis contorta HA4267-MV1]|jgi:ubiquinone/menaquinone biosynthesis C-methylase UbiE|nr:class I SAM-dependent methyltransferase [Scytonematopsis contorta HA4267-MV1]
MLQDNSRIAREEKFHDQRFTNPSVRKNTVSRFYSLARSIEHEYKQFLFQNSQGKTIVEYGCGTGSYAFDIAKNGAEIVTGIDISSVAIDIATVKAKEEGIEHNLYFQVMNAENLTFENRSIDIICGSGILHHLDIQKAMYSISLVLKPNGKAIFIEPLGHNFFINLFRSLTPGIRSEDEHPLLDKDLVLLQKYFRKVEIKYFYFTALVASIFVGLPGFSLMLSTLEFLDELLFKLPFMRKQAWQVLIQLSEPVEPINS